MARMTDRLIGTPNPAPLPRADLLPREIFRRLSPRRCRGEGANGQLDLYQGDGL